MTHKRETRLPAGALVGGRERPFTCSSGGYARHTVSAHPAWCQADKIHTKQETPVAAEAKAMAAKVKDTAVLFYLPNKRKQGLFVVIPFRPENRRGKGSLVGSVRKVLGFKAEAIVYPVD